MTDDKRRAPLTFEGNIWNVIPVGRYAKLRRRNLVGWNGSSSTSVGAKAEQKRCNSQSHCSSPGNVVFAMTRD